MNVSIHFLLNACLLKEMLQPLFSIILFSCNCRKMYRVLTTESSRRSDPGLIDSAYNGDPYCDLCFCWHLAPPASAAASHSNFERRCCINIHIAQPLDCRLYHAFLRLELSKLEGKSFVSRIKKLFSRSIFVPVPVIKHGRERKEIDVFGLKSAILQFMLYVIRYGFLSGLKIHLEHSKSGFQTFDPLGPLRAPHEHHI
jgi:hypothetical protein